MRIMQNHRGVIILKHFQRFCIQYQPQNLVSRLTASISQPYSQSGLSAIMWQIYFHSNLNLFSVGSSVQMLIQGILVCIITDYPALYQRLY